MKTKMMNRQIVSVYEVTDYKTGKRQRVHVEGDGQSAIKAVRKEYPRFTKFVLEGFEIDSTFVPLKLRR